MRTTICVMLLAAATACSGSDGGAPDGGDADIASTTPRPTGSVCPGGSTLTYESFGRTFFDDYCQSCHASSVTGVFRMGAPSTITFDDVDSIRSRAGRIDEVAAAGPDSVNVFMPAGPPRPTDDERRRLGEWLACGAP